MSEDIFNDINNVFFPKDAKTEWLYSMVGKGKDIFNMVRQDTNDETKEGIGLISLDDDEIQIIINSVYLSKDYIIIGEMEVALVGTSIQIPALIVDNI